MSAPKFYATKLIDYGISSSIAADADAPLENLYNYYPDEIWRSSAATNGQTLTIDFLTAKAVDFIALQGQNWDGTVVLEADSNEDFSTATEVIANLVGNTSPCVIEFATVTKRYWRLRFADCNSVIPELGQIFLDTLFDFVFPYEFPFKDGNEEYETSMVVALDGRIRTSQPYDARKVWEIDVVHLNDTIRENFRTFFTKIRGKATPFYFANLDGSLAYVHCFLDVDPSEGITATLSNIKKILLKGQMVTTALAGEFIWSEDAWNAGDKWS